VTFDAAYANIQFMGNLRGVERDFDALEERRVEGARLLGQGLHAAEVARRVGVHRQSVSRWEKQLKASGIKGLRKAGRAGRKTRLSEADLRGIEQKLTRGPQALGFETDLWTTSRVAQLIEQQCGVRYHPAHVWRLLQRLGWSCQRPVLKALECDEEKTQWWKKKRWPKLKKSPERGSNDSVGG
jgi:transposase